MALAYRLKVLAGSLAAGASCYAGWKHKKTVSVRNMI